VDLLDDVRLRDREEIVAAANVARVIREPLAAIVALAEPVRLEHGAHGTVEDDDPLGEDA
jgi:hypothetical protein